MNPWWLLLICPACVIAGVVVEALLAVAACADCREAIYYRRSIVEQRAFEDGFKQAISKISEVG
jgi:hypothetical protein